MRKHSVLTVIAASLLLALGQNAVACSLGGRQLTVQLEVGGAELGARSARALAEWFVQWRDGLGVESVIVVAPAVRSNRKLAEERLQHVARIFDGLNTGKAPISYEVEQRQDGFPDIKYLNSLDVSVQPACIKAGTCCHTGSNK